MTDEGGQKSSAAGSHGRVRWTRSAFRDLENAYEYIRFRDRGAARRLAKAVRKAVERVGAHPESAAVCEDVEPVGVYRHVVVSNYRVIYMVDQDGVVVVLRVWDTRRDPSTLRVGRGS